MTAFELGEILALERRVWDALVSGDAAADRELLHPGFLGVYKSGFAGRNEHAGQLADGPTIASYDLSQARLKILADNVVLLAYVADYVRTDQPGRSLRMYVSSIWERTAEGWRGVFSQDTDAQP